MARAVALLGRAAVWLSSYLLGLLAAAVLLGLLVAIVRVVLKQPGNTAQWLLVYLTALYAALTSLLALAAVKSARASERSAKAMEESLQEAKQTRWAQFGAVIALEDTEVYVENTDGTATIGLLNLFGQPIMELTAAMWDTELNASGNREVKYSSMRRSKQRNVLATESRIDVLLEPAKAPDSECRRFGEIAATRFFNLNNRMPQDRLLMVWFGHRVDPSPAVYVYDLRPSKIKRVVEERAKKIVSSD